MGDIRKRRNVTKKENKSSDVSEPKTSSRKKLQTPSNDDNSDNSPTTTIKSDQNICENYSKVFF